MKSIKRGKRYTLLRLVTPQEAAAIQLYAQRSPWILRITEHNDKPAPVFIVKERFLSACDAQAGYPNGDALQAHGLLYGLPLRRCLPIVRAITDKVCDNAGIPLELHRFFNDGRITFRITFRGALPLDEEAGTKLALIFKLQERIKDMDRVELIARRVERFSREEASYWLSRITQYGAAASRWALAGMRIMLGGQSEDKAVLSMLEKLKQK
jgi:hypothetical protein